LKTVVLKIKADKPHHSLFIINDQDTAVPEADIIHHFTP
jgi:hypothetical protein